MKLSVNVILFLVKCSITFAALTNHWEVPEGRIVGGHEAIPHSYPYLVSLQIRFLWARLHLCGATLLNEYWILTAAHCIKQSWLIRWLPMDAVIGTHDVDNYGPQAQVVSIDRRIPHPQYKGDIGPFDIAMLKTKIPVIFTNEIQPVTLPTNFKINSQSLTLAGWGALRTTLFFPDMPAKLQEVNVTYIHFDDCYQAVEAIKEANEENPLDRDANICTGPITGGIAACNGDSGGPLIQFMSSNFEETPNEAVDNVTKVNINDSEDDIYYENNEISNEVKEESDEEKVPVVIGIVSWGASPCGEKGAPTVYTKVSQYLDFISQYINT